MWLLSSMLCELSVSYWLREHKRQGSTLAKYEVLERCVGEGNSRHYVAAGSIYFMSQLWKEEKQNMFLKIGTCCRTQQIKGCCSSETWQINVTFFPRRWESTVKLLHPWCSWLPFSCQLFPLGMPKDGHFWWALGGAGGAFPFSVSFCCLAAGLLIVYWARQARRAVGMKALFVILINLICNTSVKDVTD